MNKRRKRTLCAAVAHKNILLSAPSGEIGCPPRGIPSERGEMAYRVKCGEHEEEMMEDPLDPLPAMDRERETDLEMIE